MIKEIGFVCYPVVDMARARKFYESVLGLTPSEEFSSGEWVEYSVGSGTLSLGKMEGWNPVTDGANLAFEVSSLSDLTTKLKAEGITFKMEPQDFPNCKMALVVDTEGNLITLHQKK